MALTVLGPFNKPSLSVSDARREETYTNIAGRQGTTTE